MSSSKEIVREIWTSHKNYLSKHSSLPELPNPSEMLARCFCPGPFYYYLIDSPTLSLDWVSNSSLEVLGIEPADLDLFKIVECVHPEDKAFLFRCEDLVAYFLKNCIAPEKMVKYKICYCVRLKTRDGSYRLFLFQTLTLQTTAEGALLKVFGVHTDISHISNTNNYKLSFIGLDGEPSFTEIDVMDKSSLEGFVPYDFAVPGSEFSNRELEVLKLLANGLSTAEIARELKISVETINTHRKNMIRKAGAKNSIDLVVTCVKKGYV